MEKEPAVRSPFTNRAGFNLTGARYYLAAGIAAFRNDCGEVTACD